MYGEAYVLVEKEGVQNDNWLVSKKVKVDSLRRRRRKEAGTMKVSKNNETKERRKEQEQTYA